VLRLWWFKGSEGFRGEAWHVRKRVRCQKGNGCPGKVEGGDRRWYMNTYN